MDLTAPFLHMDKLVIIIQLLMIPHTTEQINAGTGKTYTMEGRPDSDIHAGVIPRSIHYIFDSLEKSSSEYPLLYYF